MILGKVLNSLTHVEMINVFINVKYFVSLQIILILFRLGGGGHNYIGFLGLL